MRENGYSPDGPPSTAELPAAELPYLLDVCAVARLLSTSRSSVYRLIAAGKFPKGEPIRGIGVRWHRSVVEQWAAETAGVS